MQEAEKKTNYEGVEEYETKTLRRLKAQYRMKNETQKQLLIQKRETKL